MKAPNKIYLYECPEEGIRFDGICTEWAEKPVIYTTNVCFINKDALLEWLDKEKLEELKPLLDTDPYREAYIGKCEAFKEVINKLNSM